MPNLYATLEELKTMAAITDNSNDDALLDALEEGSRQFEKDTDRFFYIYEGTFYQDGGATRVILDWDVQTITTLKCDTDGDSVYESTYSTDINGITTGSSPDAFVYPANILPKTRLEANPWGQYGHFGAGIRRAIEIVGTFGYGNDWPNSYLKDSGTVLAANINSTATSLTVSTANLIMTGNTLKIGSEQVFVYEPPTGLTIPIERGINGTVAAAQASSASIQIYQYPKAVKKAVLIYAMRIWKRRESAFQNAVGNPNLGTVTVWKSNDPDYDRAVVKYHKERRGWYLK